MNYLCNWHRYGITDCQSEILFVMDFNTFISSSGHLNKRILLMVSYPFCALSAICLFLARKALFVLSSPCSSFCIIIRH